MGVWFDFKEAIPVEANQPIFQVRFRDAVIQKIWTTCPCCWRLKWELQEIWTDGLPGLAMPWWDHTCGLSSQFSNACAKRRIGGICWGAEMYRPHKKVWKVLSGSWLIWSKGCEFNFIPKRNLTSHSIFILNNQNLRGFVVQAQRSETPTQAPA